MRKNKFLNKNLFFLIKKDPETVSSKQSKVISDEPLPPPPPQQLEQASVKTSSKDKESFDSSISESAAVAAAAFASQESSSSARNDDVIRFWKKCIRHGSAIVKRLKESDNLIKIITSTNSKKVLENSSADPNSVNLNQMQVDSVFGSNLETTLLKHTKELKKRLYIIASLLGINTDIGFDDISIDSNKSEIIESYIKKIFQELINSSSSTNLAQYSATLASVSPKQIDSNSIELLISIYEDLKQKFLNQFERFNKESKLIFNSSSSAAFRSSTTENNDDESSSSNKRLINPNVNKSSTSRTQSIQNKSPVDYEFSSNNEDDSSTYLYDSPTSSLESSDLLSNSNPKLNTMVQNQLVNKVKTASGASDTSRNSKEKQIDMNYYPKNEENSFDDGLICKIMQNYIDLFKNKENHHLVHHLQQTEENLMEIEQPSTSGYNPLMAKNSNNNNNNSSNNCDTSSDESNKKMEQTVNKSSEKSENENKIEEECIKNLSINIYNDCFKCLFKASGVDKQQQARSSNNDTESE